MNGKLTDLSNVEPQIARARVCHLGTEWMPDRADSARSYTDSNVVLEEVPDEAVRTYGRTR